MTTSIKLFTVAAVAGLWGCSAVVPKELADARAAYQRAAESSAGQVVPAEVHKARVALEVAERAFADDPDAPATRDFSYVAERKAELAQAMAAQLTEAREKEDADNEYHRRQGQMLQQTRGRLNQAGQQLAEAERQRADDETRMGTKIAEEQQARAAAEQKAADAEQRIKQMQESLAKLAAVKEETRGMVITLSGSVLFASNQAVLLPEAQARLTQVADALLATRERNLVVEGHTDSRGGDSYNLDLSQRRADAVRTFLVQRGYEADRVVAHGIGKQRPIANNDSPEGRANNRRVEIIVEPAHPL